jgi:hypothetical protein
MEQAMNTSLRLAVCAVVALPLAACSDDGDPSREPAAPAAVGDATEGDADADFVVVDQARLSGPGRWALPATGDPEAPVAVFDVPAGFTGRDGFVWAEIAGFANVTYEAPTRVFADPCDAEAPSRRVGPSVEDLATELGDQGRGSATEPVATEIDGYSGLYLERTVTARDLEACEATGGVRIWETAAAGSGREYDVAVVDRYWILDVDGRRVVLSVLTQDGTDESTVAVLTGMVEGAQLVEVD